MCIRDSFLVCRALVRSPFGAVLRGIRENEAKTTALGYNTRLYKIAVVAVSYGLGGLAGALYAPFAGFANTELLFWLLSGQVLIMSLIHISEPTRLLSISYAVFCLKKKK